jgi:hypothetical protein
MTKTSVFGKTEKKEVKKPIKFIARYDGKRFLKTDDLSPKYWEGVVLIAFNYCDGLDLMWAYDDNDPNSGCMYLGHWNDGVV